MGLFKRHKCRGQVVKVEILEGKAQSRAYAHLAGTWTRRICRCSDPDCGKIFAAELIAGEWTVEELNK